MLQREIVLYFPYKRVKKVPQLFGRERMGGRRRGKAREKEGKGGEFGGLGRSIAVPGKAVLRAINRNFLLLTALFRENG